MLFTTHLASGALLARLLRRPALVAPAGLASHVALDLVPHWGTSDGRTFLRVARVDGLAALALGAGILLRARAPERVPLALGMAGACLIDLDKPFRHFFGASPFPARLDDFHARIQEGREAPHRWWTDALTGAACLAVLARSG